MNCFDIQCLLDAYADDELVQEDQEAVTEHLKTCPNCAEQAREIMQIRQMLKGLGEVQAPVGFAKDLISKLGDIRIEKVLNIEQPVIKKRKWNNWKLYSSVAACLVLVLVAGRFKDYKNLIFPKDDDTASTSSIMNAKIKIEPSPAIEPTIEPTTTPVPTEAVSAAIEPTAAPTPAPKPSATPMPKATAKKANELPKIGGITAPIGAPMPSLTQKPATSVQPQATPTPHPQADEANSFAAATESADTGSARKSADITATDIPAPKASISAAPTRFEITTVVYTITGQNEEYVRALLGSLTNPAGVEAVLNKNSIPFKKDVSVVDRTDEYNSLVLEVNNLYVELNNLNAQKLTDNPPSQSSISALELKISVRLSKMYEIEQKSKQTYASIVYN